MSSQNLEEKNTLAIALGSNVSSHAGDPTSTLIAVRPQLKKVITEWILSFHPNKQNLKQINSALNWRWSPLYQTEPIGGPSNQDNFINAVVLVDSTAKENFLQPSESAALDLLERFLNLEREFGRDRNESSIRWGPRTLDIDLLSWGEFQINNPKLVIPHPRMMDRNFVIVPLASALNFNASIPIQLSPHPNWPE